MDNKDLVDAVHKLEVNVTEKLTEHTVQLKTQCDKLDALFLKVEQNQKALFGMGGENDGLVTKIRNLESSEQNHKYTMRALFGMVVGIISKIMYDLFRS